MRTVLFSATIILGVMVSGILSPALSDQSEWCHPSDLQLTFASTHENILVKFSFDPGSSQCTMRSIEESRLLYNKISILYNSTSYQVPEQCLVNFEPSPHRMLISEDQSGLAIILGGYDTVKKAGYLRTFYLLDGEFICPLDAPLNE
jgi:hypothetical protein